MPSKKHSFLNFQLDHMTMHVDPKMYNACYVIFRILFGVEKDDVIYEKRREWVKGTGEKSMTFAVRVGQGAIGDAKFQNTIFAIVQPSEPESVPSHSRELLKKHSSTVHWQHVALRTNDLLAFHKYALERGVNFITPIMQDEDEDVIQVFSGEWYLPGTQPTGVFFEFVQRNPTPELLKKLEEHNRQSWFKDKTFIGLYQEKEMENQSGNVKPFLDEALFKQIQSMLNNKNLWKITEDDVNKAEKMMLEYAKAKTSDKVAK